jgi:uncharacterized protein YigA (DUF484 family)
MPMNEHDLAEYLRNTPDFFDRHAELLAQIQLISPHGKRAVSLQERQIELQRDKTKTLELKVAEMVRYAQENDAISSKLLRWVRALLAEGSYIKLPVLLTHELKEQFSLPQVGLKLWRLAPEYAQLPATNNVSDDAITFANSLSLPYCGINSGFEAANWLPEPAAVRSLALIPLRPVDGSTISAGTFGLLVIGSPDPQRFTPNMGTEFLQRIGELSSAALAKLLPRS